jgi:hypothetical protein
MFTIVHLKEIFLDISGLIAQTHPELLLIVRHGPTSII